MEGGAASYEYGIMGLACKREILQVGDPVTFQVDTEGRATNIVPIRRKRRATVESIKGETLQFGDPVTFQVDTKGRATNI